MESGPLIGGVEAKVSKAVSDAIANLDFIVLGKDTAHIVCEGIALLLRKFFLPF